MAATFVIAHPLSYAMHSYVSPLILPCPGNGLSLIDDKTGSKRRLCKVFMPVVAVTQKQTGQLLSHKQGVLFNFVYSYEND